VSHDLYASWATAELTRHLKSTPGDCFQGPVNAAQLSMFANRESGRVWPIPDGRISAEIQNSKYEIAVELKRTNEGLHGVLTAIGQSQAYLHKGYTGSIIIVPESYDSHSHPGDYIRDVINATRTDLPIGVFSYQNPDTTNASPFAGKLQCHKPIGMPLTSVITTGNPLLTQKSNTQWAHLREGSSEPHAFFVYLQLAKQMGIANLVEPQINLPPGLVAACNRLRGTHTIEKYLSNSVGDTFHDFIWRHFWFKNILTPDVAKIWSSRNPYVINNVPTLLQKPDGSGPKVFFSGKSDSIKNKLIAQLNGNTIAENDAWDLFATNIRNRAHSYREDIDSGLSHLGFIESDGKPSELGYKFVDACERTNDCHSGRPMLILGSAILKNGSIGALLHYFYKLSEQAFTATPLRFTQRTGGALRFQQLDYLNWVKQELANNLKVMNTASIRGGVDRKPFQGEFAVLRKFNLVGGFRIGVGLEINWPLVQEYLEYEL